MPITNYSVLAGDPASGKVVTGSSTHYQITMNGAGGPFIESVDGSEVLYAIKEDFTPPDPDALTALSLGMHALTSVPGGLALDFVRSEIDGEPMITKAEMTLLPKLQAKGAKPATPEAAMIQKARAGALRNAVTTLLDMTVADKYGVIYAFGSAYADSGRVDGIHDIHMNQGNPLNNHGGDNGIWQDGALFIHLPAKQTWTAVFIAFQTQSWQTDDVGNPA
jgi:uncharacterized protein YukJ